MMRMFESKRAWLRRQLAVSERVAAAPEGGLVRMTDCAGDAVSQLLAFGKKCGDAMVERERLACMTAARMRDREPLFPPLPTRATPGFLMSATEAALARQPATRHDVLGASTSLYAKMDDVLQVLTDLIALRGTGAPE